MYFLSSSALLPLVDCELICFLLSKLFNGFCQNKKQKFRNNIVGNINCLHFSIVDIRKIAHTDCAPYTYVWTDESNLHEKMLMMGISAFLVVVVVGLIELWPWELNEKLDVCSARDSDISFFSDNSFWHMLTHREQEIEQILRWVDLIW